MTTLLLTHRDCLDHDNGPGHPERADRLRAILGALEHRDFADLAREDAPLGDLSLAELAHPPAHVAAVAAAIPSAGRAVFDADTSVSPGSLRAAQRALGAAERAVDAVMTGEADNAFCAVRPPGHHAEATRAMGFCLFNAAAVAARHAQRAHGAKRVAIVDFDVHHGNGTQDIFWDDASVLFVSTHQMPLYPGTGASDERGGRDTILNVPLEPGTDGPAYREIVEARVLRRLEVFAPDLVILSAGFDAHRRDPLAHCELTEADFAWITDAVRGATARSAEGRVVSLLEGGYDLDSLSRSAAAHVRALMGLAG